MNKMQMPIGTKLRCREKSNSPNSTEIGKEYSFVAYIDSEVPKNCQNAVMTWYPNKPIWTDQEYEKIREQFMQVKLAGVSSPQWLRDFDVIS